MAQNRAAGLDLKVLEDREVLFAFDENDAAIDIDTGTFVGSWHSGGLEPADSTWALTREVASSPTNLTGGQTVTSYTAGAVTSTVDLIPGSPVLDLVEWPETVAQDGVLYRKHSSRVARALVARVHHFASGVVGIMVTREPADITVADRSTATDPTARTVNIAWNNGQEDEIMAEEMFYIVGEGGDVARVTQKVFQNVDDVQSQIDAGTAFVPNASDGNLTAYVVAEDEDGLLEFTDPAEEAVVESTGDPEPTGDEATDTETGVPGDQ